MIPWFNEDGAVAGENSGLRGVRVLRRSTPGTSRANLTFEAGRRAACPGLRVARGAPCPPDYPSAAG